MLRAISPVLWLLLTRCVPSRSRVRLYVPLRRCDRVRDVIDLIDHFADLLDRIDRSIGIGLDRLDLSADVFVALAVSLASSSLRWLRPQNPCRFCPRAQLRWWR